jgi:hypothetical protein
MNLADIDKKRAARVVILELKRFLKDQYPTMNELVDILIAAKEELMDTPMEY